MQLKKSIFAFIVLGRRCFCSAPESASSVRKGVSIRDNKQRSATLSAKLSALKDPEIESILGPLRAAVDSQAKRVQVLKRDTNQSCVTEVGTSSVNLDSELKELNTRKNQLKEQEIQLASKYGLLDLLTMDTILRRRFFYDDSFSIYGGVLGLKDLGPLGCVLKNNILKLWRDHFVIAEHMFEVESSILTCEQALRASGHVSRFCDLSVTDVLTNESYRADTLIKEAIVKLMQGPSKFSMEELQSDLSRVDGLSKTEAFEVIKKYEIKAPKTGSELTEPDECNLMFSTVLGGSNAQKVYLRPETAQGIFVNFNQLYRFNHNRLPFAAAQIGLAFRNEISPKGLIRLNEFTLAEIEHFVDPTDKSHPRFAGVRNYSVDLLTADDQIAFGSKSVAKTITIGDAVDKQAIANESLAYFIARTHQFLLSIGIDRNRLRFRQHLPDEMAHYACDCWDAECKTFYGWLECVGIADRSCYDLVQHESASGVRLAAWRPLDEPRSVETLKLNPVKVALQNSLKMDDEEFAAFSELISSFSQARCREVEEAFAQEKPYSVRLQGKEILLTNELVKIETGTKLMTQEQFVPAVIEPSFGIGRITYAVLSHTYKARLIDERRTYFSLPPAVAPMKCVVLPLGGNVEFDPLVEQLSAALTKAGVSHIVKDQSDTIGKRYTEADQCGIPFAITVDVDSLISPNTATIRERDTLRQLRATMSEVPKLILELSSGVISWTEMEQRLPKFTKQQFIRVEQLKDLSFNTEAKSELD